MLYLCSVIFFLSLEPKDQLRRLVFHKNYTILFACDLPLFAPQFLDLQTDSTDDRSTLPLYEKTAQCKT